MAALAIETQRRSFRHPQNIRLHCLRWKWATTSDFYFLFGATNSFSFIFKGPKKKLRAKIIEYYVEVATECYDKGNFNSAMAIIGEDDLVVIE